MGKTTNLGLHTTATNETSKTFLEYRTELSGTGADSNMNIIDKAYGDMDDKIDTVNVTLDAKIDANKQAETDKFSTLDDTVSGIQSSLSQEVTARTSEDQLLNTRIDELVAPSGEAPSAAEVQDARVGVDSTTYASLGAAIRGQVGNLKSDLNQTNSVLDAQLGLKNHMFNNNGYIKTTESPVDKDDVKSNSVMSWAVVPCVKGDTFVITGTGAEQGRLWAFIASDGTLLTRETTYAVHYENLELTAPESSAYLIANARMDYDHSLTSGTRKFLNITDANLIYGEIEYHPEKYPQIMYTINSDSNWQLSSYVYYALVPINKNTEYTIINNTDQEEYIGILKDGYYADRVRPNFATGQTGRVTIPANGGSYRFIPTGDAEILAVQLINRNSINTTPKIIAKALFEPVQHIVDNMVWSWWIYPTMKSFKRVRDKLYWTFVSANGDAGIASYDYRSKVINRTVLNHAPTIDDHSGIAMEILNTGKIVCAYATGHNDDTYMHVRVSTIAEDISAFDDPIDLQCSGTTTYAQLFKYAEPGQAGKLYLFYRTNSGNAWAYRISSDYGKTWSEQTILIVSTQQYYCAFRPTTTRGVLRVCMMSNPDKNDRTIRQAFLHLSTMELYNSNNISLLGTSDIDNTSVSTLIGLTSGYDTQRLLDVGISDIESPMILYTPFNLSRNNDSVYKLYNAGTVVELCRGGEALWNPKYQLGACFKGNTEILLARNENNVDIVEKYGVDGTLKETYYREDTTSIPIRNFRPVCDVNGRGWAYLRGYYNPESFKDFNTDAVLNIEY